MDYVADEAREILDLISQWQAEGVDTKKQFDAIASCAAEIIIQLIQAQAPLGLTEVEDGETSHLNWIDFLESYIQ